MGKWYEMPDSSSNNCPTEISYYDSAFRYALKKTIEEWDKALKKRCDCCHIWCWWKHLWD